MSLGRAKCAGSPSIRKNLRPQKCSGTIGIGPMEVESILRIWMESLHAMPLPRGEAMISITQWFLDPIWKYRSGSRFHTRPFCNLLQENLKQVGLTCAISWRTSLDLFHWGSLFVPIWGGRETGGRQFCT